MWTHTQSLLRTAQPQRLKLPMLMLKRRKLPKGWTSILWLTERMEQKQTDTLPISLFLQHIREKPVTQILPGAFQQSYIQTITIPDTVTSIGENAFKDCTSLTPITIPDSVTSIGASAFEGCTGLTSVTIPDSVTSIGDSAFKGCPIETATIPALAANHINNSQLKTVTITSGERINERAFSGCASLTAITIPDSVTSIGSGAFFDCAGLKDVYITDIGKWCGISFLIIGLQPRLTMHTIFIWTEHSLQILLFPTA